MILRPARAEDASALAALWNPWVTDTAVTFAPDARSPEDIARLIELRSRPGRCFLLAHGAGHEGGRLLGFVSYDQFRGGPGYARSMEHTVILSPEARGKGVGRALMTAMETHARAAGHRVMVGAVSAENPEGRAFHLALGYAPWGTIPEAGYKFGRHIDLWLLGKLL